MSDPAPARVLLVANRTAATEGLARGGACAARGADPPTFHLVVPAHPHGLHKVVDPQDGDAGEAERVARRGAAAAERGGRLRSTGHVGDAEPLMAIEDAINPRRYDEIVISTLPPRISRWLHLDLVSKARGLGLPVTHVRRRSEQAGAGVGG